MEPMEPPWIRHCKHFLFSSRLLILQLVFKVWLKQSILCAQAYTYTNHFNSSLHDYTAIPDNN